MPGFTGTKGFTPEGTQGQGSALNQTLMGNMGRQAGGPTFEEYLKTHPTIKGLEPAMRRKWQQEYPNQGFQPAANPSQSFTYKPGEAGYNTQSQYTPANFQNLAEPYYAGIQNSATEAAKMGAQSGMEGAMGMAGRRGIGRSGVAQGMLGNVADTASRNIADVSRQVGFQRAQDYTALQGQQDQANRAAEGLRQQGLTTQSQIDAAMRGEKMGYYNTPIQQMMALYGANMGAPGNQPQQGWGGGLIKGVGAGVSKIGDWAGWGK